jgi:hypothetical protein
MVPYCEEVLGKAVRGDPSHGPAGQSKGPSGHRLDPTWCLARRRFVRHRDPIQGGFGPCAKETNMTLTSKAAK